MPRQSREKSGTGIYQMIIGTVPLIGDNLNYPREVQFTNGDRIQYIYSPDGQKLRATWQTAVANIVVPLNSTVNLSSSQVSSTTRTDYIGNVIYTGTASSSSASVKLSKYLFEGGYATVTPTTQPTFHYYTQDHLGNNRAVVNQSGTVERGADHALLSLRWLLRRSGYGKQPTALQVQRQGIGPHARTRPV